MAKKTKILLVEDDKKFASSLVRILTEEGFECVHAEKPQTAISLNKLHTFEVAIVDCMLPQMNGIDLSLKLKEGSGNSISIYLMSGIYKDRNFSVSALKKTNAKSFLIKPFDVKTLVSQIQEAHGEKQSEGAGADTSIKGIFFQDNVNLASILSGVEAHPQLTSLEVPLLIQCLTSLRATCTLNLTFETQAFQLYFSEGRMLVNLPKYSAQELRSFLARKDFVIGDDIQNLPESVFTLKKLQEASHISPHFTAQVEKEIAVQSLMKIRENLNLTATIVPELPQTALLDFTPGETDDVIYDWILATPLIWYKAFYVKHMNATFRKMSTHQAKTGLFPIVAANKHVVSLMMGNRMLADVMSEAKLDDETFFKLLHMLVVYREFYIGEKKQVINHKSQIERLRALLGTIAHQDAYERLGLSSNATDQEIKKSFTDLSQTLHPDKLIDAPDELLILAKSVYEKIQEAYAQIKSADKRLQYKTALEAQKKENLTTAVRLLDQAYNSLVRGDLTGAEGLLQQAENLSPHSQRLKMLQAWTHLKTKKHPVQQIARSLQTLSQEEKDSATYHFIRGLVAIASNEPEKAVGFFNNTLAKDSDFMPARRELAAIPKAEKKSVNIFSADLKDVVGLFFKKK